MKTVQCVLVCSWQGTAVGCSMDGVMCALLEVCRSVGLCSVCSGLKCAVQVSVQRAVEFNWKRTTVGV